MRKFHLEIHEYFELYSSDVSHYITVFYNQVRLHSTLNYQTPNQFEQNIDNLLSELSGFT